VADKRPMPPVVRPNIRRQLILMGLAIVGIGIGYGLGFIFKKEAPEPELVKEQSNVPVKEQPAVQENTEAPKQPEKPAALILPQTEVSEQIGKVRAYEEALPHNIVETVIPPLVPLDVTVPPSPLPISEDQTFVKSALDLANSDNDENVIEDNPEQASISPEKQPKENTTPPAPLSVASIQTWQINALPFETDERPKIVIVIDDMGIDRKRSERTVALNGPLTLSYLTYGRNLQEQTSDARKAGHELLMHIPMEPTSRSVDPGPNVLLSGMEKSELLRNLRWNLDQFEGYVGINNHMGSRFTSNLEGMQNVMAELKSRGLLFLDSVTSAQSKGSKAARSAGIPHLVRNVFLDHVDSLDNINKRLRETEHLARRQGHAIAIGHPRDHTLDALGPWLTTIEDKGFQLVPLTALLNLKQTTAETGN
jgi:polysaccharide deacetylase 2 family uncharacterized protein YibQ